MFQFHNWSIKNQILIISLVSTAVISIATTSAIIIFINYLNTSLLQGQLDYFDLSVNRQIQQYLKRQSQSTYDVLKISQRQLLATNQFFKIIQAGQILSIQQAYGCLNDASVNDTYSYNSSFCYLFYVKESSITQIERYNSMKMLSSLLTEYYLTFDFRDIVFFASILPEQYFSQFTGQPLINYQAQKRAWYIKHMNYSSQERYVEYGSYISQALSNVNNDTYILQSINLTYPNGSLAGIFGESFYINGFIPDPTQDVHVVLTDSSGVMIFKDGGERQPNLYVYDKFQSGFTRPQWTQIQQSITQGNQEPLKLFNNLYNETMYIRATYLQMPQFYIMIYTNASGNMQQLQIINKFCADQESQTVGNVLLMIGILVPFLLILQVVFIEITLMPIQQLISQTRFQIYKFKMLKQRRCSKLWVIDDQSINNLIVAFHSLKVRLTENKNKNTQCEIIQDYEYPRQTFIFNYKFSPYLIQNGVKYLKLDIKGYLLHM